MNHTQTASHPVLHPKVRDTGQYTISVSKKGVGEEEEPYAKELDLVVAFSGHVDSIIRVPTACWIDIKGDGNHHGITETFDFTPGPDAGEQSARISMVLDHALQPSWWIDIYLVQGEYDCYTMSAYLSTLLGQATTVTCTFTPQRASHHQDE